MKVTVKYIDQDGHSDPRFHSNINLVHSQITALLHSAQVTYTLPGGQVKALKIQSTEFVLNREEPEWVVYLTAKDVE